MEASELKRIKELEEENVRLKKMYANLTLELDTANTSSKKVLSLARETVDNRTTSRTAQRHQ